MRLKYLAIIIICISFCTVQAQNKKPDVYVVGAEYAESSPDIATLWKNGIAQKLSDGGFANSVFVLDSDIYVVGWRNSKDKTIATLWKNGVVQNLVDGTNDGEACSIYVSGDDVYVAGYVKNAEGKIIATLWKNGAAQNLTNGNELHPFLFWAEIYMLRDGKIEKIRVLPYYGKMG